MRDVIQVKPAVLAENINPSDYFANRVDIHSATRAAGWIAFRLIVNTGAVYRSGQKPKSSDFLLRSRLSVNIVDNVLTVSSDGKPYYSIDVTNLISQMGSHQHAEAFVGYGPRQVILLLIDNDFAGARPLFFTSDVLNPEGKAQCHVENVSATFRRTDRCQRPGGHAGEHQALYSGIEKSFAYASFSSDGGGMRSWEWLYGIPTPCSKCGFILEGDGNTTSGRLCSACSFWKDQKARAGQDAFVINGIHYRPGKGGFYGRRFKILRHDGTSWEGELFTQGLIPEYLRDEFPDNGAFVEGWV